MEPEKLKGGAATPAQQKIDYEKIARAYNDLEVGGCLRLSSVYNITSFKAALARRGLRHKLDCVTFQRGSYCYINRISPREMAVK